MNQIPKLVSVTPPAAIVDNAALTCAAIDCAGYNFLIVGIYLGALDIAPTVLKLTESDDDSAYSDLSGATFSGVLPAATDDNKFFAFLVDLRGVKRFIKPAMTVGDGATGTFTAIFGLLSKGSEEPYNAATMGCSTIVKYPANAES